MYYSSPRIALLALALAATARAAPDPGFQRAEARREAALAVGAVRGAVVARDDALRRADKAPAPATCAALATAASALDEAWDRYLDALTHLATLADLQDAAAARSAAHTAEAERAADLAVARDWADVCAGLPPVGATMQAPEIKEESRCGLTQYGAIIQREGPAPRPLPAGFGLSQARWLAARAADALDFLVVVVPDADPLEAERALAVFDRGLPGLGAPATHRPAHLPGWRRLQAVVVVNDLRRGPSLRGLLRAFANRLDIPGCSPGPGGGWGHADVGGQLGGGRLRQSGSAWRFIGVRPDGQAGLTGNGGNAIPFAPLELYLLGLLPLDEVPAVTFLRAPRPSGDRVEADGTCRLTATDLRARFGERPRALEPYRLGVLLVGPASASPTVMADALAFTHPGPDDDPFVLNYFEATGGLGRLTLHPLAPRGCTRSARRLP